MAREIVNAFKWNWEIPHEKVKVKVKVEDGWVTLDGVVEWNHQKVAAKKAVTGLVGILGVTDSLVVKSEIRIASKREPSKKPLKETLRFMMK